MNASDLAQLLASASVDTADPAAVRECAVRLLHAQRAALRHRWIDSFLQEYGIETPEGLALLTLAEAYLRIPDGATAARLIAEKLAGDWRAHAGASPVWRVNALTRALMLAGAMLGAGKDGQRRRSEAPIMAHCLRPLVAVAMQVLGRQYVFGRDISRALRRTDRGGFEPFGRSYDMLGESARTRGDAERYLAAYQGAIAAVGARADPRAPATHNDGISVKLSALNCRYEPLQRAHAVPALVAVVSDLARAARARNIGLTIDAEESERLEMSLEVIAAVAADSGLRGWDGFGFAVQAYQRRAPQLIGWAQELARNCGLRLTVRLVKGAYWDIEIKRAQELGLAAFPVHTRKCVTDVSFLACARALLAAKDLYPAFATHNARTVATLLRWCGERRDFEFQRLHGMGSGLYERVMAEARVRCRIYAPVGGYAQLLPYLVRRILENSSNTGFVYQLANPRTSDAALLADPVTRLQQTLGSENEAIVTPKNLYVERPNSGGIDFSDRSQTDTLLLRLADTWSQSSRAAPRVGGQEAAGIGIAVRDPADCGRIAGMVVEANPAQVADAFERAQRAQPAWAALAVEARAACLERTADLLESEREMLMALAVREAGKNIPDALAEVREAVDFCRYYAAQARLLMRPVRLPGPTGELNELRWVARGVFACVSPWNFPLSIFLGQIGAALVTGNAVVAKPAPQTPLIAAAAVRLLLRAGIPADVLAFLPGGDQIGAAVTADRRVAGVAFTGSNGTARRIAAALLADESRPLVPLLAETGGLNAMLVDSTALPERAVTDVIASAFQSAGQRCSSLRLLCLQEDIAAVTVRTLIGAMAMLRIGDPGRIDVDVGPVIDAAARQGLEEYLSGLNARQILYRCPLPEPQPAGHFVAPTLVQLARIEDLQREVFGPVLHVVTWRAADLDRTIERINASGYGLTMGLQTRLSERIERVQRLARVGNLYVNRSMIGAVVGSQPFGGEGLSGTGPKAGGPNYLARFMTERTLTVDTTAAGANVQLLRQAD